MPARRLKSPLVALLIALLSALALAGNAANARAQGSESGAESAAELLRQAQEHESAHDDLVALRRYTDALALDPALGEAYLGLGSLRLRTGDPREAERVFDVALARIPSLHRALIGRAEARWALGLREQAEGDIEAYAHAADDPGALRELAGWYADEARLPAELATWRRIRAMTSDGRNPALEHEAQTMVRALQIAVGGADPVTKPLATDPVRRGIARIANRGG